MRDKHPIIVVGCSGGIGAAVCRRLSANGSEIVGIDIVQPSKPSLLIGFHRADLRQTESVSAIADTICKRGKRYWGLVYCAGIYPIQAFADYTTDLWDSVHAVNVRAPFQLVKKVAPIIVNGGRVILISSGAAYLGSRDVGYSASKTGMLGLTRSLAKNLAARKILVNAICPGPIETQMSARMSRPHRQRYLTQIPLRRFGKSDEVAVAVAFLLDPQNSFMTGTALDVSGGLAMQ
jgi:NAD(P)-dependent dehydrogenase (short-subunit alcohol dehydrogenase family)